MLHQPAEAFRPSPTAASNPDTPVIVACETMHAARDAHNASDDFDDRLEAVYSAASRNAFAKILEVPATTYAGLAAKARVLVTEIDDGAPYPDEASVAARIAAGITNSIDSAAFGLSRDLMLLARIEVEEQKKDPDAALHVLLSALLDAKAQMQAVDDRAEADGTFDRRDALMPVVPEALFFQAGSDTFQICDEPGRLPWETFDGKVRHYYAEEQHTASLRWKIAKWRENGTGGELLPRAEEIIAALDPYMAAVKHAEDLSGVTAFQKESGRLSSLIDEICEQVAAIPAKTAAGVAAKARVATVPWSSEANWLETEYLPGLIAGEKPVYDDRITVMLAISVIVDAMKLGAPLAARANTLCGEMLTPTARPPRSVPTEHVQH